MLTTGDFNGDGIIDLVAADPCENTTSVLLGKGDGSFSPAPFPPIPGLKPTSAVAADFDGDGRTDLAIMNSGNQNLLIFKGEGNGNFVLDTFNNGFPYTYPSMQTADFNGDGVPDLVTADSSNSFDTILLESMERTPAVSNISLHGAGNHTISMTYSGDSEYFPSSAIMRVNNITATPQLSPAPGSYQWTQSVTLTDPTPGSVIYYTLDGTMPTTASIQYATPISVTWGSTINAMAVSTEATYSPVVAGIYSIDRPLPPPSFGSPSGTYPHPFTFSLAPDPSSCTSGTCILYYTINGAGYTRYTGPVTLSHPGTYKVKAISTAWHFTTSNPASATYTIK